MGDTILIEDQYFFEGAIPFRTLCSQEIPYLMPHAHTFIEIAYVVEGEGIHYIGDEKLAVSKGDLFFLPPTIPHVFQPRDLTGRYPLRVLNCLLKHELSHLTPTLIFQERHQDLALLAHFTQEKKWLAYRENSNEFIRLLQPMHDLQQKQHSEKQIGSLILQLLSILKQRRTIPYFKPLQEEDYPVHKAVHYMSMNFRIPIKVSDVSQRVAISCRHFQRLFKLHTERSFIQMLQDIRLHFASCMLERMNISVQSIAQAVGIFDMKFFYQLFRARYGMTPAAYRLQHQSYDQYGRFPHSP